MGRSDIKIRNSTRGEKETINLEPKKVLSLPPTKMDVAELNAAVQEALLYADPCLDESFEDYEENTESVALHLKDIVDVSVKQESMYENNNEPTFHQLELSQNVRDEDADCANFETESDESDSSVIVYEDDLSTQSVKPDRPNAVVRSTYLVNTVPIVDKPDTSLLATEESEDDNEREISASHRRKVRFCKTPELRLFKTYGSKLYNNWNEMSSDSGESSSDCGLSSDSDDEPVLVPSQRSHSNYVPRGIIKLKHRETSV